MFLGIATFTYLYKKSNFVLTLALKELVMVAVLFLVVGLLLSYIRFFHGQKLSVGQLFNWHLSVLSVLPVVNHLIPQTATQRSKKADGNLKKVRQFK